MQILKNGKIYTEVSEQFGGTSTDTVTDETCGVAHEQKAHGLQCTWAQLMDMAMMANKIRGAIVKFLDHAKRFEAHSSQMTR